MSLRSITLLLPIPLALPCALGQNNLYSGNGWERVISKTQLPAGSGTFDRVELGQFVGDPEPDLLILRGDQLLLGRDVASLDAYEEVMIGVVDFAVLHDPSGDRFVVATTNGADLYSSDAEGGFGSTPLTTELVTQVREVQLGASSGIAAWGGATAHVFDSAGLPVRSVDVSAPILDVVTGDFLVSQTWDLAVLTAQDLFVYDGSGGGPALQLSAVTTNGRLGFAPGSASGLDLLLWLDGPWLHNFNELWLPNSFSTVGTNLQSMVAVDYHADPGGLSDLVVVDRTGRQAMALVRNDPATAAITGWEFFLPANPNTTFWIPLDAEAPGIPLPSVVGDHDLDGDADLIAIGGANGSDLIVRPGERVDAEAERIKLFEPYLEESIDNVSRLHLGLLALDSSTKGAVFPATASHVELTVWEDPGSESPPNTEPVFQQRYPIGSAPGQIPNTVTGNQEVFHLDTTAFSYDATYYVRLRAIRADAAGEVVFPSRIDAYSFDNPEFWTPPAGWQTYPYVPRYPNDPDGTGGLRGGGGGPTPPGGN